MTDTAAGACTRDPHPKSGLPSRPRFLRAGGCQASAVAGHFSAGDGEAEAIGKFVGVMQTLTRPQRG
ncbi:MAG: hypothetical protein OXG71_02275 [Rhodospirillales bacterium]|nr:hypothetical protein [Rhodospirillales bacterium]